LPASGGEVKKRERLLSFTSIHIYDPGIFGLVSRPGRPILSRDMGKLEIIFLGTGTSQGIPMIGCPCEVCASPDPRDNRTRSSIFVRTPQTSFIVDTGPDLRTQCLREGLSEIDAVVFTHSHTDHIMGFDDLRRFCDVHPRGALPIYASPETMADLRRAFAFAFQPTVRYPGYLTPEPHLIEGPFRLGELEITPLPVPHGRTQVNGYLFSRGGRRLFAYLSDCKAVPDPVRVLIEDVEALAIDALRHNPHPTHLSLEEALETAAAVRARRTWLTHLCHDLGHAETEKSLPENVRIAYDGFRLEL
jgi:phosphoribosyl 1,2-cyclic phosphate phosphodiesterase